MRSGLRFTPETLYPSVILDLVETISNSRGQAHGNKAVVGWEYIKPSHIMSSNNKPTHRFLNNEAIVQHKPLPRSLYQFCSISADTLSNLSTSSIWVSDPASFNDPFDLPHEIEIKPTKEQLAKSHLYNTGKPLKPEDIDGLEFDVETKERLDKLVDELKNAGIVCFTEDWQNILMWSHYANKHTGMCLEFSTDAVPDADQRFLQVEYQSKAPSISIWDFHSDQDVYEFYALVLATKHNDWSYEKEWRYCYDNIKGQAVEWPTSGLRSITFGDKVSPSYVTLVGSICQGVDMYKAEKNIKNYRMIRKKINWVD